MKKLVTAAFAGLLLLAGCGEEEQPPQLAEPIEVALNISPDTPAPQETVTFSIAVKQSGAPVPDASDVKIELWKEGQESHETIPAVHQSDGVYTVQKTLAEPGTYNAMYHVTARDFHSMNKQTFTVKGEQPKPPTEAGHSHGDHHNDEVSYHLHPDGPVPANTSVRWSVHLQKEGTALDKATVQFEYWKNGGENPQFVDARETSPGEYAGHITLPAPGSYTLKIHVEKGAIHDHKEFAVTAQ